MSRLVQLHVPRHDLRDIIALVHLGAYASAFEALAMLFGNADDLDARTLGFYLELAACQLPDDDDTN